MSDSHWSIRSAVEEDLPFIYSTWSMSYRYDSAIGKSCKNSIFFREYNQVIDWILFQSDTRVVIACDPKEQNVIYGYMVHQPNIVHYAFTKETFCKFGIAKSLLNHLGGAQYYTHKTFNSRPITNSHPEMIFNPFLLYKQEKQNGQTSKSVSESSASLCGT